MSFEAHSDNHIFCFGTGHNVILALKLWPLHTRTYHALPNGERGCSLEHGPFARSVLIPSRRIFSSSGPLNGEAVTYFIKLLETLNRKLKLE